MSGRRGGGGRVKNVPFQRVPQEEMRPIGGGASDGKPMTQEQLLAQILRSQKFATTWAGITLILVIGIGAALIVAGFAVQASGDMMTRTSEATVSMHDETIQTKQDVTKYIESLRSQFPIGQDVTTTRQVLGVVENVHKITSRAAALLKHVEPQTVTDISNHLETITNKVDLLFRQVSEEEMTRAKVLFDHMQELVAGVTPSHVTKLMDGVSETAKHVGVMSKEAEETHLVRHSAELFNQAQNAMGHLNGGQGLSLGWGIQQQQQQQQLLNTPMNVHLQTPNNNNNNNKRK